MISTSLDIEQVGTELHDLVARLFPICRSITGNGVRQSLAILQEYMPLEIHEVATGTDVFDWVVPREWNVRDAFVKDESGQRVIDFGESNLHLVSGSAPIRTSLLWSELKKHLHTLSHQPTWIPYRTCFYRDDWGFCLTQKQFDELEAGGERTLEVVIDSSLENGTLTYGEYFLPGESTEEVLFSAHICHPSLANDNLSGISIATSLAIRLAAMPRRRFSYRFLFAPATIGAITWLAQNYDKLDRIRHGLVLALLGDAGQSTYKRSRVGNALIDRIVEQVLKTSGDSFEVLDFVPYGYDERQYCSPGINLPMGCLMRTPNGRFPEYHTSADDLQFVRPASLADSLLKCLRVVEILENDLSLINLRPNGEPRLGKHGLYESLPDDIDQQRIQQAIQWVLSFSDGDHSLFDIAERSGLPFSIVQDAASLLSNCNLVAPKIRHDSMEPTITEDPRTQYLGQAIAPTADQKLPLDNR